LQWFDVTIDQNSQEKMPFGRLTYDKIWCKKLTFLRFSPLIQKRFEGKRVVSPEAIYRAKIHNNAQFLK